MPRIAANQFPDTLYTRVLETNETAHMGIYQVQADTELTQIQLRMNKQGTATGSESFKIQIFGDMETDTPLYESTSFTVNQHNTDVSFNALTSNWISDWYFDFSNVSLNAGVDYYLFLNASSYTRNADTFYIGFVMDNAEPVLTRNVASKTGGRTLLIGFE